METIAFSVVATSHYTEVYDNDYAALRMLVVDKKNINKIPAEEWNAAGFYILLNGIAESWSAYVGKAPAGLKKRVSNHIKGKEFWTRAILIRRDTSNGFSSAAAGWLEARFYDLLSEVKNCEIENSVKPVDDTLPDYATAGLERTTRPILALLEFLGYDLSIATKERSASAKASTNTFLAPQSTDKVSGEGNTALKELIASNVISPGILTSLERKYPGKALLNQDGTITFDGKIYASPSGAGLACRRLVRPESSGPNGWDFWGTEDSQGNAVSLGELKKRNRTLPLA